MDAHSALAIIISLAVLIGYFNYRFVRLQSTIAIMAGALIVSIVLIVVGSKSYNAVHPAIINFVKNLHFGHFLMQFLLGSLLFAGALFIDLSRMKQDRWEIGTLAVFSTVASTFIVGTLMWLWLKLLPLQLGYAKCLLFGALISPTDPIAVLAIFKKIGAPETLTTIVSSESLFNDGVGVVLFATIYSAAFSPHLPTAMSVIWFFIRESIGGIFYGLVAGWVLCQMMKSVKDYKMHVLLTIAFVFGGYCLANAMELSGLLAMVVMGIFVGNYKRRTMITPRARRHLEEFWEIIDELFNAILFLMLGLEIVVIHFDWWLVLAAVIAIVMTLLTRYVTVAAPMSLIRRWRNHAPFTISILTWGGLRGGLAVALALAIPNGRSHEIILCMTYGVVLFAVLVQGTTIKPLAKLAKNV
ncbi:MAG: sodium:proton antiporter [Legionellaceae bacterium]|nr:sodium:proton antiporter [Legionellaceae bacterium]